MASSYKNVSHPEFLLKKISERSPVSGYAEQERGDIQIRALFLMLSFVQYRDSRALELSGVPILTEERI